MDILRFFVKYFRKEIELMIMLIATIPGKVAELVKAIVCKTIIERLIGSNPILLNDF